MSIYKSCKSKYPKRIFYVTGAGNIIKAHEYWANNKHDPSEVSITFSSQVEEYCKNVNSDLYAISKNIERDILVHKNFTLENRPVKNNSSSGYKYYLHELAGAIKIWFSAVRFRADAAILESGCMPYFMQSLFALSGIQTVQVLHNTLWPKGYSHKKPGRHLVAMLDKAYFQWFPIAVIGVSPECCRQVRQLVGPKHPPLYEFRAQFDAEYFNRIPPPPPHANSPFTIVFVGRVVEAKGVFDILDIAFELNGVLPNAVKWHICGTGRDIDKLKSKCASLGLCKDVAIHGWVSLELLARLYGECHAAIVPTRSSFEEGLAMTAAEAVLAGRPVITNDIVPAAEILGDAAILAEAENTKSYVEKIVQLVKNPNLYEQRRLACANAGNDFLDKSQGYTQVLHKVFSAHFS